MSASWLSRGGVVLVLLRWDAGGFEAGQVFAPAREKCSRPASAECHWPIRIGSLWESRLSLLRGIMCNEAQIDDAMYDRARNEHKCLCILCNSVSPLPLKAYAGGIWLTCAVKSAVRQLATTDLHRPSRMSQKGSIRVLVSCGPVFPESLPRAFSIHAGKVPCHAPVPVQTSCPILRTLTATLRERHPATAAATTFPVPST